MGLYFVACRIPRDGEVGNEVDMLSFTWTECTSLEPQGVTWTNVPPVWWNVISPNHPQCFCSAREGNAIPFRIRTTARIYRPNTNHEPRLEQKRDVLGTRGHPVQNERNSNFECTGLTAIYS
jgi:hypothetical protein